MSDKKLVVLAYSGGLDTSVICRWLVEKGYRVLCCVADLGQGDNFSAMRDKAIGSGAEDLIVRDVKEEFVRDGLFWAMQAQAKYEGLYIPCTAVARYFIMREVINAAHEYGAEAVAHGATAKGNDQVRFEFRKYVQDDSLELIAPWRIPEFYNLILGRKEAIEYACQHNIPVVATEKKPFSTDSGIGYRTHESGVLENIAHAPPDDVFELMTPPWRMAQSAQLTITWGGGNPPSVFCPDTGTRELVVYFDKGFPVAVDGCGHDSAFKILTIIDARARSFGIGITDMVEDRFLGMKSHGVYEIPGLTLLYGAYQALQQICLTKEELYRSLNLSNDYGIHVYEGWWNNLRSKQTERWDEFIKKTREKITGRVSLRLWRGGFLPVSRSSPNSLYDEQRATMEKDDSYDPSNVEKFLRAAWEKRNKKITPH